jgi:hypothetical protein
MKYIKITILLLLTSPACTLAQAPIENGEDNFVREIHQQRLGKLYQSAGTQNLSLLNHRAASLQKQKDAVVLTEGYTPYNGNWTQINTAQSSWGMGRINCFAIHPADPNTIFAGTPTGGLWKTTNNGSTWNCLTSAMVVPGVSGICINPGNPNIMYILTGSASSVECQSLGVFKTTDGGINWLPTGLDTSYVTDYYNTTNFNANKLIMDPANSNVLLAAMTTGLYRTSDAGATWTRVISDGAVRDVVFHPTNSNFVYVTVAKNTPNVPYMVARASRDNGANFGSSTYLVTPSYLYSYSSANIAVSPAAPDSVFFVTTSDNGLILDSDSIYVLRSIYVNSNRSFSFSGYNKCLIGSGGDYASSALRWFRDARLAISPTTTAEMYVSGLYAYSTSNYGKTWRNKYLDGSGNVTIHSDATQIDYKNGYVYATNDGGIYRQLPSTATATDAWTILTGTMPISQIFKLGASQVNSTDFVTALQDNGNHSISSTAYTLLIGGDGIMARMSPNTPGTYYFRPNNYRTYRRKAGVNLDISPANITSFGVFEIDQANENRIYTADKNLYISTAQGDAGTWVTKTTGAARATKLLAASKTNNQVFWLLESEGYDVDGNLIANAVLRRTINGGTSFQTITLPAAIPINLISSIVVSPFNDNKVFITVDGYNANAKVFETSNGLAASASIVWNNLTSTQLPNVPVLCLAYENSADNSMYVGTEIGMYYYNSIMNRWIPFNNGMPICRVNDLHINYSSLKIIAGTYGRGIFISDFYTNCYPSITFSGSQTGTLTYSAGTTLSSSAQLSGGQASAIKYYSGTNVFLTPGFNTESGTKFLAAIGPCGGAIDSIFNRVADSSVLKNENRPLKSSVPNKNETKENQNILKGELKKPGK